MRYKALLLVMIVVGTSLLILASAPSEVKAAPHEPIFIESDAELESMADTEGWVGSGSAVDPFIIENYIIDANNASNGIRIRNIDHHIVIRNCVVHNTSDDVYIPSGDGIYLASVENATIEGCEVYDTYDGIGLYECKDILVKGNDLHDNRDHGVDVGKSSVVRVTENTCTNNSFSGIYIWLQSSACRVDNNTCDLSDVGIMINSSPNNFLEDNYCHQNHDGISLISSDGSMLRDNNCSDNEGTGFQIRSDDVAMSGDAGTNNSIAIDIQDAKDVLIENVNFTANQYALYGTQLNGITVRGGNFSFNEQPGIYLALSQNISTDGNRLYKNNNNGIYLDTCSDSLLGADWAEGNSVNGMMLTQCTNVTAGPTCVANVQNGVRMDDCFDCHIMSGNLSSNMQNGVRVFSSDECSVMDCDISNNDVGIAVISSSEINVDGNIIIDCNTGIYSESSSKDMISHNRLNTCFAGIWVFLSDYENIHGNNVTASTEDAIVVINNADHCVVDANEVGDNGNNGVYVSGSIGTNVTNNLIYSNVLHGMIVLNSPHTLVAYNHIIDVDQDALRLTASDDCTIIHNLISGHSNRGIYAFNSIGGSISFNDIEQQTMSQIALDGCEGLVLQQNDCQGGLYGIYSISSPNSTISYGNISDAANAGIYLFQSNGSSVLRVRAEGCGIGLLLDNLEDCVIAENTITDSVSFGISLEDCSDVQVYGNALIDNNGADNTYDVSHIQASDSSALANRWNSTGTPGDYGNLWSDWLTPDADLNGFVDAPYLLAGGAQDNAPVADASAPELQILTPTNLGALNAQYAQITWQGWDNGSGIVGYGLSFDGASTWVDVGSNTSYLWDPISEGIHQIKVNATDRAGLYTVVSVLFYMDRTAPVVTFLSPANFTHTNQSVAVVTWSGSDATTAVDHYKVRINDHPWTSTTDTTFTTPAMTESWNQVWINATDTAGNWAIFYLQIFVDTEGPQIEIVSPSNGVLVGESSVNIVWTIEDLGEGVELCEISIDSGPWTNVTGVTSYIASGLTEGPHTVQIQAIDGLGNQASTGISFGVDLYAPTVSITSPANNTSIGSGSVTLQWTGSDSSGFGVDRYEVQIDSGTWNDRGKDTSWTITGLLEGEHTLRVRAFDNLGRNSTDLVVVDSDDEAPLIGIDNIAEGQTLTITNINVTWTAFDSGSDIARFEVRLDAGEWQDRGLEQWAILELTEGMHNLTVRGHDQLGNIGQDVVNFSVDVSAPIVEINYPSEDAVINNKTVQVFYLVSDPSGIRWLNYTLDGVNWTRVNYPSDHVTLNISDGPVHFALKAIDLVGWERTAWSNFTRDSAAPAVTAHSPNGTSVPTGSIISVSLNEDIQTGSLKILVDGVEQAYTVSGRTYNVSLALVLGHTYTVSAQNGTDIAGNRMGNFTWTFSTPTTGTITGRVVDSDGDPIEGAFVRAGSYSAMTDFQGEFLLSLPPGSYNLTITASGREDKTIPVDVNGDMSLGELTMGSSSGGMDTLLIGAILAVIALVAVAAFVIIRRKKK